MTAPSDTTLSYNIRLLLQTAYRKVDQQLNPLNLIDNLSFDGLKQSYENGRGPRRANLQYYDRWTLNNSSKVYNLDGGVTNKWNETLNYDSVKTLVVYNRASVGESKYIQVNFKNEQYIIGPQGSRVIHEPDAKGIQPIVSSGSAEEGQLTIQSDSKVTYDLIILGSDSVSSSSSG